MYQGNPHFELREWKYAVRDVRVGAPTLYAVAKSLDANTGEQHFERVSLCRDGVFYSRGTPGVEVVILRLGRDQTPRPGEGA
jgi:hypothetical protein